jgi:hypothetical protein
MKLYSNKRFCEGDDEDECEEELDEDSERELEEYYKSMPNEYETEEEIGATDFEGFSDEDSSDEDSTNSDDGNNK